MVDPVMQGYPSKEMWDAIKEIEDPAVQKAVKLLAWNVREIEIRTRAELDKLR